MNRLIITVLGKDRPGIIALVTNHLFKLDCNLENVNQMIMQQQFAGFFIVAPPQKLTPDKLQARLDEHIRGSGLIVHVNRLAENPAANLPTAGEIFMVTTIGPDQKGLVARFSKIMADHDANIVNLKAVFKGGDDPFSNIMNYQVDVGNTKDPAALFDALRCAGKELELDVRIQHKNIFNVTNKI